MFSLPVDLVGATPSEHILAVRGAGGLKSLLLQVDGLEISREIQENWGVYFEGSRHGRRLWVGANSLGRQRWMVHFHVRTFLRSFSKAEQQELAALMAEFDRVLRAQSAASEMLWCDELGMREGAGTPDAIIILGVRPGTSKPGAGKRRASDGWLARRYLGLS